MNEQLIRFMRDYFRKEEFIPLHVTVFTGKEKNYVTDTIGSTIVSRVGAYVERFEKKWPVIWLEERVANILSSVFMKPNL